MTYRRVLHQEEVSVAREARYIVERAQRGEARAVSLGVLVLFSTHDGDAWILDSEDHLAFRLAQQGEQLPFRIVETEASFAVEWNATYTITKNGFVVQDNTGKVTLFPGYPVQHISDAVRRTESWS